MKNQTENYPQDDSFTLGNHFVPHFLIGMLLGVVLMLVVGILIGNVGAGIAIGPALGAGLGFGIHAILNKKNAQDYQPVNSKMRRILISILGLGMILLLTVLVYLIIN